MTSSRQKSLQDLAKYVTNIHDYEEFQQSDIFKALVREAPLETSYWETLEGFKFSIHGNLDEIKIGAMNRMTLVVTYSLRRDMLQNTQKAVIFVPENLQAFVRTNLNTTTGIKLVGKVVSSKLPDVFELDSIAEYNLPLKFGQYICSGDNPNEESGADACHHNWGSKPDADYCMLCGSSLKYITDMYEYIKTRA